jgi:lysophospholipase L1-like esterase
VRALSAGLALCISASAACTSARSAPPSAGPAAGARYLALGDSFTIGTGSTPAEAYPARLTAFVSCGVELRNAGVNGYTTDDVIAEELPELARFTPTFVTLAIGANDIVQGRTRDEYRAHVRQILAAVKAAGVRRIVSLPQPDWSLSPAARDFGEPPAIHARIVDANAILRDETLAAGGAFVDLFPLMEEQARAGMLARDGLHPSAAAYGAWAAELARQGVSPCG